MARVLQEAVAAQRCLAVAAGSPAHMAASQGQAEKLAVLFGMAAISEDVKTEVARVVSDTMWAAPAHMQLA
eukprot:5818579-Lingulodinium_polyedra.AAC.1